ncbi:MAG: response regulator [Desulfomonile tiedjei]|nr:response regulator [Desulfomonile tiedjei]
MANSQKRILILDDEEIVVNSLKSLLCLETTHDVLTFTSCQEALEAIRRTPIDLAISDFLMPEMDGVSFLKEVRRIYPAIQLIILTGFADKESAIRAINEVRLYQYLEKPWDNDEIIQVIESGLNERMLIYKLQEYSQELEAKVRQLEQQVGKLKPQP